MSDIPRVPADLKKLLADDRFLRSLATSLVGPGPDADDAAQHTWLRSLQSPPKRAGSLRAFLGTVLKNRVRKQIRDHDRRARHEQAAARDEAVPSAAEMASQEELRRRVGEAVMALEEPYRTTIWLRYREHLPPREVARRMGVPVETVRTRSRRALDMLRRKLDRSYGDRQDWVSALAPLVGTQMQSAAASLPGVLAAKKVLLGTAVAALVVVVTLATSNRDPQVSDLVQTTFLIQTGPSEQAGESVSVPAAAGEQPTDSPSPASARQRLEVQDAQETQSLARIDGRSIAAETGLPLATTVRLVRRTSNAALRDLYGEAPWEEPAPVITAADGRFELTFVATPGYRYVLGISAPNRASRYTAFPDFEPGQKKSLGDISIGRGYQVGGWVVDESGDPVEGVVVFVDDVPFLEAGSRGLGTYWGASGPDGRFSIPEPIPAGTWPVGLDREGWRHLSPTTVSVNEGVGTAPLQVVVKRMPTISGVVFDESGRPVSGLRVRGRPETPGSYPSTRTEADGTFVLHATREDEPGMRLQAGSGGREYGPYEKLDDGQLYEWGAKDVRLEVRRALSLQLRVVEWQTGEPVENYAVACYRRVPGLLQKDDPRLGGHHPDGKLTLNDVWRGRNRLRVFPKDRELRLSHVIEFDAVEPGPEPIVVQIIRMERRPVRVVSESGEPIAGATVEVVRHGSGGFEVDSPLLRPRDGETFWTSVPAGEAVSHERTDRAGLVSIPVPFVTTDVVLRVTGNNLQPALRSDLQFPDDGSALVVVMSEGSTLSGRVLLDGFVPQALAVIIRHPDGSQLRNRPEGGIVRLERDGSFLQQGIDPGEYSLSLGTGGTPFVREWSATSIEYDELQRVVLRAGQTVDVELDGTKYKPGTLRGRIFLDGEPLAGGRVRLMPSMHAPFATDAEGRFVAEQLRGDLNGYSVEIQLGVQSSSPKILVDERVNVEPGQEVVRDFFINWQKMRIRLLTADGQPLRETRVELRQGRSLDPMTTDEEGWIVLDPILSSPVTVTVNGVALDPLEVPAGEKEATFELRVR